MSSYCYVGRYNHDKVYVNENTEDILKSIDNWAAKQPPVKTPNQIDNKYYCIDIGCSTDVPLMKKHYDWQKVFDYFNAHPLLKTTFATKYPTLFLPTSYELYKDKHRIRVSLMPQKYSDILEPGTDSICNRIQSIPKLQKYMEVHINFSPIIYTDGWLKEYENLFQQIATTGITTHCECIFLTHNKFQHERNSDDVRKLLWRPEIQESKNSQYAADNIRYKYQLKAKMIEEFKKLYENYFDTKYIRYIF
jgi:DNA repair photolyase